MDKYQYLSQLNIINKLKKVLLVMLSIISMISLVACSSSTQSSQSSDSKIVQQADIIILDEPTSQLDYGNQLRLVSQVSTLVKRGFGVIMTTHMPDHVFLVGGEVAILDKKGNLNVGKVDDVMTNEALSELYESEINIVEVKGFNRKICIASDW